MRFASFDRTAADPDRLPQLYCTITAALGEEACLAYKEAPKCEHPLRCGSLGSSKLTELDLSLTETFRLRLPSLLDFASSFRSLLRPSHPPLFAPFLPLGNAYPPSILLILVLFHSFRDRLPRTTHLDDRRLPHFTLRLAILRYGLAEEE